jgi:hypothetical protein
MPGAVNLVLDAAPLQPPGGGQNCLWMKHFHVDLLAKLPRWAVFCLSELPFPCQLPLNVQSMGPAASMAEMKVPCSPPFPVQNDRKPCACQGASGDQLQEEDMDFGMPPLLSLYSGLQPLVGERSSGKQCPLFPRLVFKVLIVIPRGEMVPCP